MLKKIKREFYKLLVGSEYYGLLLIGKSFFVFKLYRKKLKYKLR